MHRFGQQTSVAVQRLPKCVHQRSHRLIVRGSLTSVFNWFSRSHSVRYHSALTLIVLPAGEDRTVETVETPVQAAPEPVQTIAPPHYAQYPQQVHACISTQPVKQSPASLTLQMLAGNATKARILRGSPSRTPNVSCPTCVQARGQQQHPLVGLDGSWYPGGKCSQAGEFTVWETKQDQLPSN